MVNKPIVIAACLVFASALCAGEREEKLQRIVDKNAGGICVVRAIVHLTVAEGGQEADATIEIPAICVDVSEGILVCPNPEEKVQIDPPGIAFKAETKSIKVVLENGKEVVARVKASDAEHGLLFLALEGKEKPPVAVPMSLVNDCRLGTEVVAVRRISGSHPEPLVKSMHVAGLLKKPRPMFLLSLDNQLLGTPVFSLEGAFVGLVSRLKETAPNGAPVVLEGVLPVDQLLELFKGLKKLEADSQDAGAPQNNRGQEER